MNIDSSDQMFYNFRLRRIVKENHGKNINQISLFFNLNNYEAPIGPEYIKKYNKLGYVIRDVKDTSNILATVADIQASIYDNEHCGDHLDIMSNFVAGEHIDLETNELLTCCWLHRKDDAILAVAGTLGKIYLISLAFSLTFKTLNGHTGAITDLRKYPNDDQHLMSASRDNTVRIWHVDNGTCEIRIWYTPNLTETSNKPIHLSKKNVYTKFKKIHSTQIDNKIEHWDYETFKIIKTFNIKDNCFNRCRFDVSLDGKYMCVGTSYGSVFIYNITKGKLVTELSHRRSTKAVKCCLFTRDYKQIIAAGQEGFICRYDYISDKTLAEWDEWENTSTNTTRLAINEDLIKLGIFVYDNKNEKFDQIKEKLDFDLEIIGCEFLKGGMIFQMLRTGKFLQNINVVLVVPNCSELLANKERRNSMLTEDDRIKTALIPDMIIKLFKRDLEIIVVECGKKDPITGKRKNLDDTKKLSILLYDMINKLHEILKDEGKGEEITTLAVFGIVTSGKCFICLNIKTIS
nr:12857_t:CDS:10 [Entrophospora candida]